MPGEEPLGGVHLPAAAALPHRLGVPCRANVQLHRLDRRQMRLGPGQEKGSKLKEVTWKSPNEVFNTFNSADIVKCKISNRIIFNVGGNKYRLITGYYFGSTIINLYIKFVGTHTEYNAIDVCEVNMFKK